MPRNPLPCHLTSPKEAEKEFLARMGSSGEYLIDVGRHGLFIGMLLEEFLRFDEVFFRFKELLPEAGSNVLQHPPTSPLALERGGLWPPQYRPLIDALLPYGTMLASAAKLSSMSQEVRTLLLKNTAFTAFVRERRSSGAILFMAAFAYLAADMKMCRKRPRRDELMMLAVALGGEDPVHEGVPFKKRRETWRKRRDDILELVRLLQRRDAAATKPGNSG